MIRVTNHCGRLAGMFSAALLLVVLSAHAQAGHRFNGISAVLESNGLTTLKAALDLTNLTNTLNQNRVTLFAPTNDVFDALADALGCDTAIDMAIALNDLDLLAPILTYHAALGRYDKSRLLRAGNLHVLGGEVTTGVNMNGLYVQGDFNGSPSKITDDGIGGWRYVVYPIDQILLPVDPTPLLGGGLCSSP